MPHTHFIVDIISSKRLGDLPDIVVLVSNTHGPGTGSFWITLSVSTFVYIILLPKYILNCVSNCKFASYTNLAQYIYGAIRRCMPWTSNRIKEWLVTQYVCGGEPTHWGHSVPWIPTSSSHLKFLFVITVSWIEEPWGCRSNVCRTIGIV